MKPWRGETDHAFRLSLDPSRQNELRPATTVQLLIKKRSIFLAIPEVYAPDPRLFIEDKEVLMARSRQLEDSGKDAIFTAHMKKMQNYEKRPWEKASE